MGREEESELSDGVQKTEWEEQRVKTWLQSEHNLGSSDLRCRHISSHVCVYAFKWTLRLMSDQIIYNNPDMSLRMWLFCISTVSWKGQTQGCFLNICPQEWNCGLETLWRTGCASIGGRPKSKCVVVSANEGFTEKTAELLFELCPESLPFPYIYIYIYSPTRECAIL